MFLIHNERTKLTAAWFNTLATALVAAGTFGPFAAQVYGVAGLDNGRGVGILAGLCFIGGAGLHVCGLLLLGRLRE